MVIVNRVCCGYRQRANSVVHQKWGARKVDADIAWRTHQLRVWQSSRKVIDRRLLREAALAITEGESQYFFMQHRSDRANLFPVWLASLHELSAYDKLPLCARCIMRLNATLHMQAVAWLTMYLPWCLKRHGIHR